MAQALAAQAERMADAVRESLSDPPGGRHDRPWRQSGALRNSVGASPKREVSRKPRSGFGGFAAEGEDVARAIGAEMAAALRDGSAPDDAGDAMPHAIQASATMPGAGMALLGLGAAAALGWALSRPSSTPNLPGPTRAPPLMNQPSPDGDESGSPEEGADPVKPAFKPNDAHNPGNDNRNPQEP